MLLRVRVSLPDRPGALGAVTRTLGAGGADILQVTVLESVAGRALDEFTVAVANPAVRERVTAGLEAAPGVRLEGIWETVEPPGAFPDLGVLAQVATNPSRGLATLVDAAPALFSAEWAALVETDPEPRVITTSWQAPDDLMLPELAPLRPRILSIPGGPHLAATPFDGTSTVLVVARRQAPPFHDVELTRLTVLADIVGAIVGKGAHSLG
ncbi:ACT domain-containing protein [Cryptosporangium phraense]|uniref:ACT domain-containing protein n=1 Tax=Cryptosporangium phraense TaxID=2593070 RepID=A0A545APL6_9ACTN|nr:ACT domain-containing protein [Cryptosporangium phraense]TQS43246.1 ACT domain-containing protein [Cryptosporangium phraense]